MDGFATMGDTKLYRQPAGDTRWYQALQLLGMPRLACQNDKKQEINAILPQMRQLARRAP
jgi:hypothetical protein